MREVSFFYKGVEFVNLRLVDMDVAYEQITNGGRMLAGQIQPVQHSVRFGKLDAADRPQAVAFDQHRNSVDQFLSIGPQPLKESTLIKAEGSSTAAAVITSLDITVDLYVVTVEFLILMTGRVVTPLLL